MFRKYYLFAIALTAAFLMFAGCRTAMEKGSFDSGGSRFEDYTFTVNRTLAGTVFMAGECIVPRGITLKLLPGTQILFIRQDMDGDGSGDSRLRVDGRIISLGEPARPVVFSSAGDTEGIRRPGDWDSLLFYFSKGNEFRYTIIEYSNYSVHAHFSDGKMIRCLLWKNNEGCRMGSCVFLIEGNIVRDNVSKGLNFRNCANIVRQNEITSNGNGLFIFEKDSGSAISSNNIYANNRYNLRLDDFFRGEMTLENNWWGSAVESVIRETIYDSRFDSEIGTIAIKPSNNIHRIPLDIRLLDEKTERIFP